MVDSRIVELPGPCVAAAGGSDMVWCVAGKRLLGFTERGEGRVDSALDVAVSGLAVNGSTLVAVLDSGAIGWLDAASGRVIAQRPAGSAASLVAGGGAVWAVDPSTSRAWRVGEEDVLGNSRPVPGLERAAADGDRLWWTTRDGSSLRDFERTVDLGVPAGDCGALATCAGSVWVSVRGGLVRVGTWGAEKGPLIEVPGGPVPFLTCSGGVLVGASEQARMFVLDFSADADVRAFDIDGGGTVSALVAVGGTAWIFAAGRAEARLVTVRAG
jgi:hypothetical protein